MTSTSPPRPPSPPSGPPSGTYFSRRKLTAPRPPDPAATSMSTSSMKGEPRVAVPSAGRCDRLLVDWLLDHLADREDRHRAHVGAGAVVAGRVVCDCAGPQCEQRVIASDTDVLARENLGATLTDQDGAREHNLAGVTLHAEALGLAVASVAGAPAAFLMRHLRDPSLLVEPLVSRLPASRPQASSSPPASSPPPASWPPSPRRLRHWCLRVHPRPRAQLSPSPERLLPRLPCAKEQT